MTATGEVTTVGKATGGTKTGERLYGGLTADQRRAERRRRLLDTALELFGTDGYAAAGIERICSRAGVTARHFYDEYGSRENLLRALYDEIVHASLEAVVVAVEPPGDDPVDTVTRGVGAFVHQMLEDPRRARVACLEVVGVSPALEAHRRNVLHLYAHLVAEQGRALGVRDIRSEQSRFHGALALVGGTNELLIEHLTQTGQDQGHEHAALDALTEDIVGVYLAVGRFS